MLRIDNGKEYINYAVRQLLERSGIVHETTAPYIPEQNGVAERANRTIVEMARTMMLDAQLPKQYWVEAASTAVHILNRCPTKAEPNKTPEEAWTEKRPNLKYLRIFGCNAMVHVPKQK